MASFTDKAPPTFNPYIQQLPVEAMVTVGMHKQKAYEEGVQKIQTQIDNIAGLDVARDVDKAYLQSKLNQLGNRLRTVASGDFSNFQLVNSVGGMTKQVIRDKGVQNAVNSTAKLRKEQSFMEEERKKGNLHPANEYVFNKQASNWMDSTDVMEGFNAKYDTHFDVDKFMRETFASLGKDGFTVDQIFKTDGNGNKIFNPKTGSYELSTTMTKLKKEGLFPEKVQQTIDHIFADPRVSKQLQINGQYNYRGSTNEELAGKLITAKDTQVNVMDKGIMELTMKKNFITDGVEKAKLQVQIDQLVENKQSTVSNYNNLITNIGENSDAVRGMLYKAEERNKYKDMYTSVIEERTVHANPGWDANFKMQQEANEMARHHDSMTMEKMKMKQQKELAILDMESDFRIAQLKVEAEDKAKADAMTTSFIDSPEGITSAFETKGDEAWKDYTEKSDQLFLKAGIVSPEILAINRAKYPKLDEAELLKVTINGMAKKEGKSPESFRAENYNTAMKTLSQNATKLKPEIAALATSVANSRAVFDNYLNVKQDVEKKYPLAAVSDLKPFEATVYTGALDTKGKKIKLTVEDQMNLAYIYNDMGSWFNSDEEVEKAKKATEKLQDKGFTPYMINSLRYSFKNPSRYAMKAATKEIGQFKNFEESLGSTATQDQIAKRAELIKSKSVFNPSVAQSIDTGKEGENKNYRKAMATYIGTYASLGQNEAVGFKGNEAEMSEIALNPNKGSIQLRATKSDATGDITNTAVFFNASGAQVGQMVISPGEAASVNFYPDVKYASPQKKYVENKMAVTGNNSTARGDVEDMETYDYGDVAFNKQNFPQLKGMKNVDVKANIKAVDITNQDGTKSTLFYNFLYVNDGATGSRFIKPLDSPTTRLGEAVNALEILPPQYITKVISEYNAQKPKR